MNEDLLAGFNLRKIKGEKNKRKNEIKREISRKGIEICAINMGNYISLKTAIGPKNPTQ